MRRTTASIRAKLLELQKADLKLINETTPELSYHRLMEIGQERQVIATQIQHEWRLWERRGLTYDDLFNVT